MNIILSWYEIHTSVFAVCATHKRAVEAVIILPATTNFKDVGELMSSVHASEKVTNRQCLHMIVACILIVDYNFRV